MVASGWRRGACARAPQAIPQHRHRDPRSAWPDSLGSLWRATSLSLSPFPCKGRSFLYFLPLENEAIALTLLSAGWCLTSSIGAIKHGLQQIFWQGVWTELRLDPGGWGSPLPVTDLLCHFGHITSPLGLSHFEDEGLVRQLT